MSIQKNTINVFLASGFLILAIFMPINNLFVQYWTKILGQNEYGILWKEVLVAVLILVMILDIFLIFRKLNLKNFREFLIKIWPIILVFFLNLIVFYSSFVDNQIGLRTFGVAYLFEIWWLNLFAVAMVWISAKKIEQTDFTSRFFGLLNLGILFSVTLVFGISLLSQVFGAQKILVVFGYGLEAQNDASGFISTTYSCHRIDFGIENCRNLGTFTQPIHFAAYLILILPVLIFNLLNSRKVYAKLSFLSLILLNGLLSFLTYSRFLLLGLLNFGVATSTLFLGLLKKEKLQFWVKISVYISVVFSFFVGIIFINLPSETLLEFLPESLVKPGSTNFHYRQVMASVDVIKESDDKIAWGYGLGASGSAVRSKYQIVEENQIYKKFPEIAQKWVLEREKITYPENWFLQVFLNGGMFYFLGYLVLIFIPVSYLFKFWREKNIFKKEILNRLFFAFGFLGIILGNLFQHLYENQTTAYYWTIIFLFAELVEWKGDNE